MGRHTVDRRETANGHSRRAFVTTAGVATAAAAGGVVVGGNLLRGREAIATPSATTTPTAGLPVAPFSRADVLALAQANVGLRWRGSEWETYFGPVPTWNGAWISWLLRGLGVPRTTGQTRLMTWLQAHGTVDTRPKPGAVVFYMEGTSTIPYRSGFVESVTDGVPQTIEGGRPDNVDARERFVRRFSAPWSTSVVFGHPPYGHASAT